MDKILLLKASSRFFHLLTAGFFIGQVLNILADIMCETPIQSFYNTWFWIMAILTGLGNMVILIIIRRPQKEAHKLWKHLLYAKLALTLPLLNNCAEFLVSLFTTPSIFGVQKLQLSCALAILLLSVYARFYREDVTKFFSVANGAGNNV